MSLVNIEIARCLGKKKHSGNRSVGDRTLSWPWS